MKKLLKSGLVGLLILTSCKEVIGPDTQEAYLPVVRFTQSATTIHLGERIEFNASSSYVRGADIIRYEWHFDDGIIGFGKINKYTYTNIGEFNPSLTIKASNGNENTGYGKTITVLP